MFDSDAMFNIDVASTSTNNEATTSALVLEDDSFLLEVVAESHTGDSLVEATVREHQAKERAWGSSWKPKQLKSKPTPCLRGSKRKGNLRNW